MYESYLCEVPDVQEILDEINENKWELISVCFISDSAQVLIVCKKSEKKSLLSIFKKPESEEDES